MMNYPARKRRGINQYERVIFNPCNLRNLWIEIVLLNTGTGSPNGNRTRVSGVRGQYPRPLDDGTIFVP